jgi:hypothetical protein
MSARLWGARVAVVVLRLAALSLLVVATVAATEMNAWPIWVVVLVFVIALACADWLG